MRLLHGTQDSIYYCVKDGDQLLPTGPLLGDLTREIAEDEEVKKMVILGAKNYAFEKRIKTTGEGEGGNQN